MSRADQELAADRRLTLRAGQVAAHLGTNQLIPDEEESAPVQHPSATTRPDTTALSVSSTQLLPVRSPIEYDRQKGLFDALIGPGWLVLCDGPVATDLGPAAYDVLERLGGRVFGVGAAGKPGGLLDGEPGVQIIDRSGHYAAWFAALAADAVIVGPDLCVYAAVTGQEALVAALDQLDDDVSSTAPFLRLI